MLVSPQQQAGEGQGRCLGRCWDSWQCSGTFGKEKSEGRPSSLLDKQVRARSTKGQGDLGPLGGMAGARGPVKGKWTRGTSCWLHGPRTPAVFTASCVMASSRAGRRVHAPGCGGGGLATCVVFAPQHQPAQKRGLGWLRVSGNSPSDRILSESLPTHVWLTWCVTPWSSRRCRGGWSPSKARGPV